MQGQQNSIITVRLKCDIYQSSTNRTPLLTWLRSVAPPPLSFRIPPVRRAPPDLPVLLTAPCGAPPPGAPRSPAAAASIFSGGGPVSKSAGGAGEGGVGGGVSQIGSARSAHWRRRPMKTWHAYSCASERRRAGGYYREQGDGRRVMVGHELWEDS